MYVSREKTKEIIQLLKDFPVVALLGPRQCGKSTLAKRILEDVKNPTVYLDLERDSDLAKLNQPELYFDANNDKLICLDEIQRKPDFFPLIRSIVDDQGKNGQFLILGSASPELIKQSSESLAGRIAYVELSVFTMQELDGGSFDLMKYWLRGGFPKSYLAPSNQSSITWRENFIRTFLERDIAQFGFNISVENMMRLWGMLAHYHGQVINYSQLANSLQVSHTTVRTYVDILVQTFMVRLLSPYHNNYGKRLIKSPRVYLRDSGILTGILKIDSKDELFSHPVFGASWEGIAIENILSFFVGHEAFFFRSTAGAEVDLILERGNRKILIECKASKSPKLGKGFYNIKRDLKPDISWVIAPVDEAFHLEKDIKVGNINDFIKSQNMKKL